ncbi:hypothetical protein VCHENC02_3623B, partial [Vibrio harveyi]
LLNGCLRDELPAEKRDGHRR